MNFLAHLYLSGENEETILGNFIADHVKGNRINKYKTEFQEFFPEIIRFSELRRKELGI